MKTRLRRNILLSNRNKVVLTSTCFFFIAIILVFGLWPFNPNPPNKVDWIKDEAGVRFSGSGHIYSSVDFQSSISTRALSLEIWLRPATEPDNRFPQIVSFWDGKRREVYVIGQWKDSLDFRIRTRDPGMARGYLERGIDHTLIKKQKVFITLTSSPESTRIYRDGTLAGEFPQHFILGDWPAGRGIFILGNSAIGKSYWEGDLTGLAIYNRVLSDQEVRSNFSRWVQRDYQTMKSSPSLVDLYLFNEGKGEWIHDLGGNLSPLFKPTVFHPRQKVCLEWPIKEDLKRFSFYQDLAVNLLGFIPFGFVWALWFTCFTRWSSFKVLILTLLIGGLLSLAIELYQVNLPTRDSSVSDLFFNILGTWAGIFSMDLLIAGKSGRNRSLPDFLPTKS